MLGLGVRVRLKSLSRIALGVGILALPLFAPPFRFGGGQSSIPLSLVAYWDLDEQSGSRVPSGGNCGSCTLSPVNAPFSRGGAASRALNLVDASDQYLSLANSADLQLNTEHFTVAVWHVITGGSAYSPLVSYGVGGSNKMILDTYVSSNKLRMYCGVQPETGAGVYTENVTSLAAAGWDGANTWVSSNAGARTQLARVTGCGAALGNFYVGTRIDSLTANPTGTIGQIWFWKGRDLTDDELTTLYNTGTPFSCASTPLALKTNLVECWDFTETSGTRHGSGIGSCVDPACDLSAVNTPGTTVGLARNSLGMSLKTVATSSQALTVDDSAGWSAITNQMTLAGWINQATNTTGSAMVTKWTHGSDAEWAFQVENTTTARAFIATVANDPGTNCNVNWTTTGLALNTWKFMTLVYDGTQVGDANRLKLYVDNALKVQNGVLGAVPASIRDGGAAFKLGMFGGTLTRYFDGALDAWGVWSRPLTTTEITTLYAAGVGVEYPWALDWNLFSRPVRWADRTPENKQRLLYTRYGVALPLYMIPSRVTR